MNRMPPRQAGLGLGILVLLALLAHPAGAASPSKIFPELAARKDALGTVSLVADIIVIEVGKPGEFNKLFLGQCRTLGNQVLEKVAEGMTAKAFSVSRKPLLCLGFLGSADSTLPVASSWDGQEFPGDELPRLTGPFHADTSLCRDRGMTSRWFVVMNEGLNYVRKKNQAGQPIQGTSELREVIGTDHLLVMRIVHAQHKKVKKGLKLLGFSAVSAFQVQVAVLDVRTGEVLWKDDQYLALDAGPSLEEKQVSWVVSKLVERMP